MRKSYGNGYGGYMYRAIKCHSKGIWDDTYREVIMNNVKLARLAVI